MLEENKKRKKEIKTAYHPTIPYRPLCEAVKNALVPS